jgi:choline monooxygenase
VQSGLVYLGAYKKIMFTIDSDISKAETLHSDFYTENRYFDLSKEKIFASTWQLIGKSDEIRNIKPVSFLEGFLNEPIILTRVKDEINCLTNVCTHRGKILIEKECQADGIRCGYHGRRFNLDGEFLSMPEFEAVKNFPGEKDNLQKLPIAFWNDFIFSSLNPLSPLKDFIAEMTESTHDFDFANLKLKSTKDYLVKAHWALYCENYLEGLHIPFVHKSLNEELDYGSYSTTTYKYSSLQTGFDEGGNVAAKYFFVFPNLMFNFYPWGISINIVKPLKKNLTRVSYLTYVNDETKLESGAGADLETVELEDQAVVESVQKGINSRFYQSGRYSPTREQGTHHFHRLIAGFMN